MTNGEIRVIGSSFLHPGSSQFLFFLFLGLLCLVQAEELCRHVIHGLNDDL